MKWCGISGSWRKANEELKTDVERAVRRIVNSGDGIITGGALGVDHIATQTVLRNAAHPEERLKVYLPVSFERYIIHLYRRTIENVIKAAEQADDLAFQLISIRKKYPRCIFDNWGFEEVNPESYYARNGRIVQDCDELYAFHVNQTKGVQDAIDKARGLGKPVHIKEYSIR